VRKLIFLFGIILVLLFMIPLVSMANMTTESPPAITNNGNEFTLVIATPDATVLSNVDGIINAGADLITAEIADMTTAQFTSSDIASTANYMKTNGTDVDDANEVITRNTANFTDNGSITANATQVTSNDSENVISISGMTNEEVYFRISADGYFNSVAKSGSIFNKVYASGMVTTLKMPINLVAANNTGSLTPNSVLSTMNSAINTPTASSTTRTIDYSIQARQKVRTLVNENQPAAYKRVVWDGRNDMGETVGAGMYFYKLVSGNFSKIQKMTLIK